MKDPAVLFYFQDFLVGTEFMTDDEVGKYIRILCHQADKGVLTLQQLKRICRGEVPIDIMCKLRQDSDGNYYQERMRMEREKRINYSESRRKNRSKDENICKTYDKHMENENINDNKEDLFKKRELEFIELVNTNSNIYPLPMLKAFCNYWTEPNKSKTKMRFELEKTFEIGRRLVTWSSRDKTFNKPEPQTDLPCYSPLKKIL